MAFSVLFVCTGNYYRSRFSEIYFNHHAPAYGLEPVAYSKGLRPENPLNVGPMSVYAIERLQRLGIPAEPQRPPVGVSEADFRTDQTVIALDEAEHRPMMERLWPAWADRIDYWRIPDIQFMPPGQALDALQARLDSFLAACAAAQTR
jgi:protein-tyrosine phosphatase